MQGTSVLYSRNRDIVDLGEKSEIEETRPRPHGPRLFWCCETPWWSLKHVTVCRMVVRLDSLQLQGGSHTNTVTPSQLRQLYVSGMFPSVWVPPQQFFPSRCILRISVCDSSVWHSRSNPYFPLFVFFLYLEQHKTPSFFFIACRSLFCVKTYLNFTNVHCLFKKN